MSASRSGATRRIPRALGWARGGALARLKETVVHVPGYDRKRTVLAVYAREGFTPRFRTRAASEGVILRTIDDMYA